MPSPVCPARSWSSPRIAQERPNASRGASDGGETTFHGKAENPHPKGRPKPGKFRRGPPADAVRALHPARATGQRQSVVPEMPPVPQKGPLTRKQGRFSPLAQTPRTVGGRVTEADRGGSGKRIDNKTQPKTRIKTPDSRSQGSSQAAGAAPTLRIRQQVQNALAAAREGLARADHELRVRRLASTGRRRQCYLPSCTGRCVNAK